MKPKYLNCSRRSSSSSPWISPTLRTQSDGGASCIDTPHVLLVDDRGAFRRDVFFALTYAGIEVTEANGVYDALRLSHRRTVDWVVIRGNLRSQNGWRCAAKLCGAPPWLGVLMHFDELTGRDRKWADVSGLARLVETGGRPAKLLGPLFAVLNAASPPRPSRFARMAS